ncbi:ABC transporter ATP-binding protein [uncultured Merdimonas sp.]|uniref:ABC transporter ATP-binding protein n=1 Tax=uncultured Merdimonas sp. TaxID=2023269 RepID=UPI00320B2C88
MIEINGLVKDYGTKRVLDHVSFNVNEGEILGLLGPNGAGKSTTMNIMTGNLSSTDGTVRINGHEILEEPLQAKKELGYLPENPPLYMDMTVKEYLKFAYRLKKCRLPYEEHIQAVCKATYIADVYDRVIKNLSKGYRQRIGIAQALIGEPKVLILDEPTSGLDPAQMIEIRNLITSLRKKHTVIFSSHILPEVQAVCDRVVVINRGKVLADDTPSGLEERLEGKQVRVCVAGPEKEVSQTLREIPGVLEVTRTDCQEPGSCAFDLKVEDEAAARRLIAARMKQSPWLMTEMAGVHLSLEDIFLKLTGKKGGKRR